MQAALDLFPVAFVGLWAYPFLGISYYRKRRLIRELAAIGTGRRVTEITFDEAVRIHQRFVKEIEDEIERTRLDWR